VKNCAGLESGAFDTVFLQHVAINIEGRAALYAEVHRILTSGGRFVSFEVGAS
jgi:SAM-dependent methyltransferase